MPKHRLYVTRDASATFVAEIELSVEEIENRCHKTGFDTTGLPEPDWHLASLATYDNVEAYEITHEVEDGDDDEPHEVTDNEWSIQ